MFNRHSCAVGLAGLAFAFQAAAGVVYDKNIIKDAGAEATLGSADGNDVINAPRWTQTGNFTVVIYGASGFPSADDPGPKKRGLNFFAGGPFNDASSATQIINVGSLRKGIDAGAVSYQLSGYLGGFANQRDYATLGADFLDADANVLDSVTLPTVSVEDRQETTGFLKRSGKGLVPVGTRRIRIDLMMTRVDGAYNDGYADALSMILRKE